MSQILGFEGWKVAEYFLEWSDGARVVLLGRNEQPAPGTTLVLRVKRRWAMASCGRCGKRCRKEHCREKTRRWNDLPWADHPVKIEYAPLRVVCAQCGTPTEALPWADRYQHETRRLQQHLGLQAASMPTVRVAAQYGLSWATVRRAENMAIARWEAQRPEVQLESAGVDEEYLGRRNLRDEKFVTIVSNLDTGEPVWIGFGRKEETLKQWLSTVSLPKKKAIRLFATDMHEAFKNAVRNGPTSSMLTSCMTPFT